MQRKSKSGDEIRSDINYELIYFLNEILTKEPIQLLGDPKGLAAIKASLKKCLNTRENSPTYTLLEIKGALTAAFLRNDISKQDDLSFDIGQVKDNKNKDLSLHHHLYIALHRGLKDDPINAVTLITNLQKVNVTKARQKLLTLDNSAVQNFMTVEVIKNLASEYKELPDLKNQLEKHRTTISRLLANARRDNDQSTADNLIRSITGMLKSVITDNNKIIKLPPNLDGSPQLNTLLQNNGDTVRQVQAQEAQAKAKAAEKKPEDKKEEAKKEDKNAAAKKIVDELAAELRNEQIKTILSQEAVLTQIQALTKLNTLYPNINLIKQDLQSLIQTGSFATKGEAVLNTKIDTRWEYFYGEELQAALKKLNPTVTGNIAQAPAKRAETKDEKIDAKGEQKIPPAHEEKDKNPDPLQDARKVVDSLIQQLTGKSGLTQEYLAEKLNNDKVLQDIQTVLKEKEYKNNQGKLSEHLSVAVLTGNWPADMEQHTTIHAIKQTYNLYLGAIGTLTQAVHNNARKEKEEQAKREKKEEKAEADPLQDAKTVVDTLIERLKKIPAINALGGEEKLKGILNEATVLQKIRDLSQNKELHPTLSDFSDALYNLILYKDHGGKYKKYLESKNLSETEFWQKGAYPEALLTPLTQLNTNLNTKAGEIVSNVLSMLNLPAAYDKSILKNTLESRVNKSNLGDIAKNITPEALKTLLEKYLTINQINSDTMLDHFNNDGKIKTSLTEEQRSSLAIQLVTLNKAAAAKAAEKEKEDKEKEDPTKNLLEKNQKALIVELKKDIDTADVILRRHPVALDHLARKIERGDDGSIFANTLLQNLLESPEKLVHNAAGDKTKDPLLENKDVVDALEELRVAYQGSSKMKMKKEQKGKGLGDKHVDDESKKIPTAPPLKPNDAKTTASDAIKKLKAEAKNIEGKFPLTGTSTDFFQNYNSATEEKEAKPQFKKLNEGIHHLAKNTENANLHKSEGLATFVKKLFDPEKYPDKDAVLNKLSEAAPVTLGVGAKVPKAMQEMADEIGKLNEAENIAQLRNKFDSTYQRATQELDGYKKATQALIGQANDTLGKPDLTEAAKKEANAAKTKAEESLKKCGEAERELQRLAAAAHPKPGEIPTFKDAQTKFAALHKPLNAVAGSLREIAENNTQITKQLNDALAAPAWDPAWTRYICTRSSATIGPRRDLGENKDQQEARYAISKGLVKDLETTYKRLRKDLKQAAEGSFLAHKALSEAHEATLKLHQALKNQAEDKGPDSVHSKDPKLAITLHELSTHFKQLADDMNTLKAKSFDHRVKERFFSADAFMASKEEFEQWTTHFTAGARNRPAPLYIGATNAYDPNKPRFLTVDFNDAKFNEGTFKVHPGTNSADPESGSIFFDFHSKDRTVRQFGVLEIPRELSDRYLLARFLVEKKKAHSQQGESFDPDELEAKILSELKNPHVKEIDVLKFLQRNQIQLNGSPEKAAKEFAEFMEREHIELCEKGREFVRGGQKHVTASGAAGSGYFGRTRSIPMPHHLFLEEARKYVETILNSENTDPLTFAKCDNVQCMLAIKLYISLYPEELQGRIRFNKDQFGPNMPSKEQKEMMRATYVRKTGSIHFAAIEGLGSIEDPKKAIDNAREMESQVREYKPAPPASADYKSPLTHRLGHSSS
ncbi:MAG TPA: hypothetical protein VLI69_02405 [Gammaproteobacteria bacterium]|nr:hypothetical protein [Gammaproteobacteria bacterium]